MTVELDHVFVGCAEGAPEAERLVRLGLSEGSPNAHPGQGTACRRFFLHNAYLELVWIADPEQARSEPARRLRLVERCGSRSADVCPFGVALRPAAPGATAGPPFASWRYQAPYLAPQLAFHVALGTGHDEPELFYLAWGRPPSSEHRQTHRLGVSRITGARLGGPRGPRSDAARALEALGLVAFEPARDWTLTLRCDDGGAGAESDLRPELPLVLQW